MPSSKDHIHCMIHLKVRILEWVAMPSSKDHIHCMIHLKVISKGHALKKKQRITSVGLVFVYLHLCESLNSLISTAFGSNHFPSL